MPVFSDAATNRANIRFESLMISSESITKACAAIEDITDEQFDDEFGHFLDTQPPLTSFFEQAVRNDKKLQEFVVYWSLIAWKCYEMESPGKAITVGWEHLTACCRRYEGLAVAGAR
jgi:hypothetical protein